MNILILNWRDSKHPFSGGAETMLLKHASEWRMRGARITWISSSFKGLQNKEEIGGINYIRFGNQYTVQVIAIFYMIIGKFRDFDIVIDCFHGIPFFTPVFLMHKKKVAVIHELAGTIWFSNTFFPIAVAGYLIEQVSYWLYRRVMFITVSKSTANGLIGKGIPNRNIHIIPNGTTFPLTELKITKSKDPTILFLGRISVDKGIVDAIKAFRILYKKNSNYTFLIAGREDSVGYFQKILKKHININSPIANKIIFKGFVDEKEKTSLLAKSWLLIYPSQKEGWGLTVIEAAGYATPTVGYDVEGLRDSIINNKTGFLTERNPNALANAVLKILSDDELRFKMGKNCISWAKNFTWEKSTKTSWDLINSI